MTCGVLGYVSNRRETCEPPTLLRESLAADGTDWACPELTSTGTTNARNLLRASSDQRRNHQWRPRRHRLGPRGTPEHA